MTSDNHLPQPWPRWATLFLAGQSVSLFGSMLVQYAVTWHLTLTTKDGVVLALATIFGFLPQAVVSIFGGVWADRHHRKYLAMGSDAVIAVATLALALLMLQGSAELWMILAAMAVRSAGAGVQTPAVTAMIPQLVPTEKLLSINGIFQSIQAAMMLLAPALAAVLYSSLPLAGIFLIDVTTAIAGIGILALIPVPNVPRATEPASYLGDLTAGIRYVHRHAMVRWLLGLNAVVMVLAAAPAFLTPLMLTRSFGGGAWELMGLELAFSIGMMLAGATIGWWGDKAPRTTLILGASVAFGLLSMGMGLSANLWVFYSLMFFVGMAVPVLSTPSMTVLQESVEPEWQGRVFGFFGIVGAAAMPLGMAIFGPWANVASVELVLLVSGGLTVVVVVLAIVLPAGRRALKAANDQVASLAANQDPPDQD